MFARAVLGHRWFFALRPPARTAWQVANAADWFGTTGRAVRADHLHITLFLAPDRADADSDRLEAMIRVGEAVRAAPVAVTLDSVGGGNRSIALRPRRRIVALDALRRELVRHAGALGVAERAGYDFHAHMTLGYRDGGPFSEPIAPVAWTATEFVLIHSHLGRTRHDVVARWPLRAAVDPQLALL